MTNNNTNETEYRLGWMLKTESENYELRFTRTITPNEMENLQKAFRLLANFTNYCQLVEICNKNLDLVFDYYRQLPDLYRTSNKTKSTNFIDISAQEMNRLLLNSLSSFRTLLDHLETKYANLKNDQISCLSSFKKMASACYNTNFPYRFFYKLRNYVQHCQLPIGYMSISEQSTNVSTPISVSIGFNKHNLLETPFHFSWGIIKDDLASQPERLELIPLLDSFRNQLNNLLTAVSSIELSLANESLPIVNNFLSEVNKQAEKGKPFVGRYAKKANGNTTIDFLNIPFDQIKKYRNIYFEFKQKISQ